VAAFGAKRTFIATGPGLELRRPLGITIIEIYLVLDRPHRRLRGGRGRAAAEGLAPRHRRLLRLRRPALERGCQRNEWGYGRNICERSGVALAVPTEGRVDLSCDLAPSTYRALCEIFAESRSVKGR
jgi:hypothetical protein